MNFVAGVLLLQQPALCPRERSQRAEAERRAGWQDREPPPGVYPDPDKPPSPPLSAPSATGGATSPAATPPQPPTPRPPAAVMTAVMEVTGSVSREAVAFWRLCGLLQTASMQEMWCHGLPRMKYLSFQFDRLAAHYLPRTHAHLKSIHLSVDFFTAHWFMPLYAGTLPPDLLEAVWDGLLVGGWARVLQVALAMLETLEDELLGRDADEVSAFLFQCSRPTQPAQEAKEAKEVGAAKCGDGGGGRGEVGAAGGQSSHSRN